MNVRKRIWNLELDGQEHTVKLIHTPKPNKREVWIDDALVYQSQRRIPIYLGSRHSFNACGRQCTLHIRLGLWTRYRYGLRMDDEVVVPAQEYADCDQKDWVFKPRTPGDYFAQTSFWLGRIGCAILTLQLLLFGCGFVSITLALIGFILLHFSIFFAVPGVLGTLSGCIALLLPGSKPQIKTARAVKGIIFGVIALLWLLFVFVVIAPAVSAAL